jgi:hypothetical protein
VTRRKKARGPGANRSAGTYQTQSYATAPLDPPPHIQRVIEAVSARDREHFTEHPDETSYRRPYVPGECWPLTFGDVDLVVVVQRQPGLRVRVPIKCRAGRWEVLGVGVSL